MIVEIVILVDFWLNSLPMSPYIAGDIIPQYIVTRMKVDYTKQCKLQFWDYAQVQKAHNNTMHACVTGSIAICLTGNAQGEYYFMSLSTGIWLNLQQFMHITLPQDVTDKVHRLSRRNPNDLDVWYCNRHPFLDGTGKESDDESTYNEMDGEGNETYDSYDDPPPVHNYAPGYAGVTSTVLRVIKNPSSKSVLPLISISITQTSFPL